MYDAPHTILGISESASLDEIHAAFRKKARQHHPDMGGDRQKFLELTEAYEKLTRQKRAEKTTFDSTEAATQPQEKRNSSLDPNPFSTPAKEPNSHQTERSKDSFKATDFKFLLTGKLPLQDQTTYFILVNSLDIFLTFLVLRRGGYEANPIANFFIQNLGKVGMISFKLCIVAAVCVIAQVVALRSIRKGSLILNFGTACITCVVLYSVWLLAR